MVTRFLRHGVCLQTTMMQIQTETEKNETAKTQDYYMTHKHAE